MFAVISAAFAPGLAILSYIYLRDKYEPEPLKLIFKMFLLGSLLVFPAYVFERVFQEGLSHLSWYNGILTIAAIEEFLKWFVLYFMLYKHIEFNEIYDGIVYAVSVSIGFASIENLGYLIFNSFEPAVILLRAFLPVSSHALFAILMGFFLGKAKFSARNQHRYLIISLIIPIIFHSIYNFILSQQFTNWIYLMIPFILFLWVYSLYKIRLANMLSPFKKD